MIKLARTGLARFQGCMPSIITPTSLPTSRQPTSTGTVLAMRLGHWVRVFMVKEETRSSIVLLDWMGPVFLSKLGLG